MATRDWSLQSCLSKCCPPHTSVHIAVAVEQEKLEKGDIDYGDIAQAYQLLAQVIHLYGERYLPLFERLHREIKTYEAQHDLLQLARQVAREKLSTTFATVSRA